MEILAQAASTATSADEAQSSTTTIGSRQARTDAFEAALRVTDGLSNATVNALAVIESTARKIFAPGTFAMRNWAGGLHIETCPKWCTDSHANDIEVGQHIEDVHHGMAYVDMLLPVFDAEEGTVAMPVLSARLNVDPYDSNPARNVPHITFEPWQDEVMECLTPDEFGAVIAKIREHCDRLDEVHTQLVQARADWQARA